LLAEGNIAHVSRDQDFRDDWQFYRFCRIDPDVQELLLQQQITVIRRMRDRLTGLRRKDRRWGLFVYRDCFVGEQAVRWMLENMPELGQNRRKAVQLGQALLRGGVIESVANADFEDAKEWYRFTRPDAQKSSNSSSSSSSSSSTTVSVNELGSGGSVRGSSGDRQVMDSTARFSSPEDFVYPRLLRLVERIPGFGPLPEPIMQSVLTFLDGPSLARLQLCSRHLQVLVRRHLHQFSTYFLNRRAFGIRVRLPDYRVSVLWMGILADWSLFSAEDRNRAQVLDLIRTGLPLHDLHGVVGD
jgi:hypothetical protein